MNDLLRIYCIPEKVKQTVLLKKITHLEYQICTMYKLLIREKLKKKKKNDFINKTIFQSFFYSFVHANLVYRFFSSIVCLLR